MEAALRLWCALCIEADEYLECILAMLLRGCASGSAISASVTSEECKGGGGKKGARDVLVQGDCRDGLAEQLWREHGIPREYVKIEAKKGGKGKR